MALALSDLSYDLLTLVRTYDRANDFERAEEYRAMLDRVTEQEQEYEELDAKYETLQRMQSDDAYALQVATTRLKEIAGLARAALDTAAERDDLCDDEAALLEALSDILSHAEA